jgi:tRNA threonylcarbamoyladenosine biosynthesis protein TsaB
MRILAFDTATAATAVALCETGAQPMEARDDPPPGAHPGHATRLMPLVVELLGDAGLSWNELDRIAVGLGPGTFTGLRIGIATARALAQASGVPLVGISTLQSLALAATTAADADSVIAVLDARRGEVFAAAWQVPAIGDLGPAVLDPSALAPETLAGFVAGLAPAALAIGDGAVRFREVLERSGAFIPGDDSELHRVTAVTHCRIAPRLSASEPDDIFPQYLRLPDAELARRAAPHQ